MPEAERCFHIEQDEIWQPRLQALRDDGKRIVTTNGTFDILHVGHIHLLREAKGQGDVLVVGLNSDASVQAYKSPLRPIVPQVERARMLLALRDVDWVMIFDETTSERFVRTLKPDVHVKDATYGYDLLEAPIVAEYGGAIHLVEKSPHSTTNIIERILEVYRQEQS